MRFRALAIALGLLAFGVALGSCGSNGRLSAKDYRAKLAALSRREDKAHAALDKATGAKSVAEIRARLTRFATDQRQLGDEVAKLKVPKDAEVANSELARGAHDTASEIQAVVTRLASETSPKAALSVVGRALGNAKGGRETDDALSQLKKKGYTRAS